jgi:hypothetical protein
MSKSIIGDSLWAEMTDGQKIEAVLTGHATLKQMSEGLLDGSDQLRLACREFLADTGPSFENLPLEPEPPGITEDSNGIWPAGLPKRSTRKTRASTQALKQRFGLPDGFVPRLQRYGRSVLLELDIYQLPNGQEFIPVSPTGTLGARRHLYALLTSEQYRKGKRGSVYVRTDGRILDYSVDSADPSSDLFDTGYTIYDLERTGRYAPELRRRKKKKKRKQLKYRQAAAGG